MNFSSTRSERLTAMISAAVAVVILAAGVTAYQSHHAEVDDVVQLESDFRFQLEVGFRHNLRERAHRLTRLDQVSKAWFKSPQSVADREKLAAWLLEATIRSMPGSVEDLPAIPDFGTERPKPLKVEAIYRDSITPDVVVEPQVTEDEFDTEEEFDTEAELGPSALLPTPASLPTAKVPTGTKPVETNLDRLPRPTGLTALKTPTTQPIVDPTAAIAPKPARLNLSELAARISGYNAGLDEVELALSRIQADDFSSLAKQINELEQLSRHYLFVSLYYESLDDSERRWVAEPRELSSVLTTLQRRIDRAQETLSGDFLGEFDANHPDQIGELRQQLAELTSRTNR